MLIGAGAGVCAACAGTAFWLTRPPPPAFKIAEGNEQQILDHVADHLTAFRFTPNPRIIVLDFPTLREQGEMLDRVAALIEKAGLPRDRVLDDRELLSAIHATGDTVSTWYYGHDYPANAIRRFFVLARAEDLPLNPQERRLHALADELGWLKPAPVGAVITIPKVGNPNITRAARAAILHHELSHGQYFTDPAYARYVADFWRLAMTPAQRAGMRHFLGSEGYDTSNDDLMRNEMQAYMFFTPDPVFFEAKNVGMTEAERTGLRNKFLAGMPPGWLRSMLRTTRLPGDAAATSPAASPQ